MSQFNWRAVIERIKNGESVSEEIANRALVGLAERTDWLKSRLEQLDTTSGRLALSSADVDSTVAGGDWVYYDPVDDIYKQALAGLEFDEALGTYLPTASSFVTGLVVDKISATQAVIVIYGDGINLPGENDIASMADLMQEGETFTDGRGFLSHTTPGKMTMFPAGAPLIPLGIFGTDSSTVRPDIRDAFDSHYHRRFELHATAGASLNTAATGWADDGSISWVDHYYLTGENSSLVALAHRRNTTKVPDSGQRRIDLEKDSGTGKLKITLHTDVDPDDPEAVDPNAVSKIIDWPAYKEEVVIDYPDDGLETDLIVAFIRRDWANGTRYDNALSADIAPANDLDATDVDGVWKINLPTDYKGWANVNPDRDEVPATARLRYISEGHYDLFEAFPPIPVEGALLYQNGSLAVVDTDYKFSYFDLFWIDNTDSPFDGAKDFQLTFVQNPIGPTETVVKCLTSVSDLLKITQLGGDQTASTGALQVALQLALAIKDADPITAETVLASIDEESRFILGTSVAELVAGANTRLVKIESDGSENTAGPFVGKVRVEAVLPTLQGETVGVALFNAKESEKNGVIYTEFLQPSEAKTAIAARIKVPNITVPSGQSLRFRLYALMMGEVTSTGVTHGIFKAEYRLARPGTVISSGLSAPTRTEGWKIAFANGYTPFAILDPEQPETKEPAENDYNLFADDLILPNDIISVRLERMANSTPFQVGDSGSLSANTLGADSYPGNIGIVGIRWTLELTDNP